MLKRNPTILSSKPVSALRIVTLAMAVPLLNVAYLQPAMAQNLQLKRDLNLPPEPVNPRALIIEDIAGERNPANATKPTAAGKALPAQKKASAEELQQLQIDLAANDFQVRKAASARLQTLTTEDMGKLAKDLLNTPSAEVLMRIHSELEVRYLAKSKAERIQASELLETMATKERLLSADPALHSLQKHWETRIEVALAKLVEMGAIVRRGTFSRPPSGFSEDSHLPARQILITKSWTGGDSGLEVFDRLKSLTGPVRGPNGLQIYLLSGHPLTLEQERRLLQIIGANRVQYRSVVALGITADRMTQGFFEGVSIQGVSKGGSAEKAGLEPGDFLLAMYGPGEKVQPMEYDPDQWRTFRRPGEINPKDPAETNNANRLVDFDQLVDRLKKYSPGDKVKLQLVKKFRSSQMFRPFPQIPPVNPRGDDPNPENPTGKVIEVEVELIGWADLPMVE